MSGLVTDVMAVSVTINWCVLCFNLVPRLRRWAVTSPGVRKYKHLVKVCQHFEDKPWMLAKIVTEQCLIWILVLLSILALCTTDVIQHPFRADASKNWRIVFTEVLFAINIGRYIFTVAQKVFLKQSMDRVQFKVDMVHHSVTLICYSLFLAYGQNLLLGLVGVVVESTTIFSAIGNYFKENERRHTVQYRRLVVIGCVFTVCFRGVIPVTFLVIAMFQQTPFVMDHAPLSVFFLSIIFFSVINVWMILCNIQRLVKTAYEKSHGIYQTAQQHHDTSRGDNFSQHDRRLQLSKNNLGYLRPYDNKNIASHSNDEKHNLNNHKAFPKDCLELQVHKGLLMYPVVKTPSIRKSNNVSQTDSETDSQSAQINFPVDVNEMHVSIGSSDTSGSDSVFVQPSSNAPQLNNSQHTQVMYHRESFPAYEVHRHSFDNISDVCNELNSISV